MIRQPTDQQYHNDEYESTLRCLERRITNIVPSTPEAVSDTMSTTWEATIELFKLAALIYLKRASRNFSGPSPQIDAMVERAYVLLDGLGSFNPAFPLLIIGCETRTDEQRIKILQHIERAMRTSSLRGLHELRSILQQIWAQDDLAVDYELDYLNRLDAVITSYRIMPSFVWSRDFSDLNHDGWMGRRFCDPDVYSVLTQAPIQVLFYTKHIHCAQWYLTFFFTFVE